MNTKHLLIFLLVLTISVKAQQPVSVHLTEKDGLPDIEFYSVLEDSKGFIWLAADKGFYRYDGKTYKQYTNPEKRGLSVFEPFEDHLGRIWTTNISGQFFYTDQDQLITFIDLKEELNGQLANFIVTENQLIITAAYSLYTVNLETKEVTSKISNSSGLSNIVKFKDKYLVIGIDTTWLFNKQFNQKEKMLLQIDKFDSELDKHEGRSDLITFKKSVLFQSNINKKNYFFKFQSEKGKATKTVDGLDKLVDKRIYVAKELNESLWVLTNNGIFIYDLIDEIFILKKHIFSTESITDVLIDKDSNYWVTTLSNGIYIIPNIEVIQYNLPTEFQNIVSMDKSSDSTVFFGSRNGHIANYNIKLNQFETTAFLGDKVSSLLYNATDENSYVATDNNSFILDKSSFKFKQQRLFNGAKSFSRISNDTTLLARFNGVSCFVGSLGERFVITNNKRAYTTFYSQRNKTAYVGYVDNLVSLNEAFEPHIITYNNTEILALSIAETTNGIIWVGTFKNGLFAIKENKVIAHYKTSSGLLSDEIEYLQSDTDQLWIATSNGLQLFDTLSKEFKNLTKTDGILSYKISGIQILENRVIIASNKGLFSFDKQRVFTEPSPSNIYFESVEVNEETLEFLDDLKLDYHQNAIKFNFNVNGLLFNQKGKYSYRLLGYNDTWITTSTGETSVKYNSLPAGNFTFQVQPIFDTAVNNNQILDLKFAIQQPFWKTWWFVLGLCIFVLGSMVLYFRRKIKKKELQRKLEIKQLSLDNELIALKLENLRSQMNPHFIFNALNSIQEYIVLNQKQLASAYLGKFADLIRTYLNHSTKGKITLQEEINCLEMYLELEKLRFEDKLHYAITTSGSLSADQVYIPTMLIQPYVENALKHGLLHRKTDRVLNISFFINDQTHLIRCLIIDNGVGREQAEKYKARSYKNHESFATKATQDRLALLNYGSEKHVGVTIIDLFEDEKPSGTQVDIKIPFTRD